MEQLDASKLGIIRRLIALRAFIPWIEAVIRIGRLPPTDNTWLQAIWYKDRLANLSSLTAKQFRESKAKQIPITEFRIGLSVETGDSLTWSHRINKLRSVKHQTVLLKTAHGDIYTKDRKLRFGLADNDRCDRCGLPDSRIHTIAKCQKALEIWNAFRALDNKAPLTEQSDNLLTEVFGIKDPIGNELTINAEIIQLLTNSLNSNLQKLPTSLITRITLSKLYQLEKGTTKEMIKTLLDKLGDD